MAFAKGNKVTRLGAQNKLSGEQKHAIHTAFELLGGVHSLKKWGKDNPDAFYSLWGRTIPKVIEGDFNASGQLTITIERK